MMTTASSQLEKAQRFRGLHTRPGIFAIPNPWDAGSARALEYLGFEALATTSMGYALSVGRLDGMLNREQTLAGAALVVEATSLPVSADLENGFGDAAEDAAETIREAAAVGLVGGSIEDATQREDDPIYAREHAAERVRAAVEAARSLPFHFTLTARAENYLWGRPDLADTIARLEAYEEAGADVLYAPGLRTRAEIESVLASVSRPVNVVMGLQGADLTMAELEALGVKRVSVGSSLARAALGELLRAAQEIRDQGTFAYASRAVPVRDLKPIYSD